MISNEGSKFISAVDELIVSEEIMEESTVYDRQSSSPQPSPSRSSSYGRYSSMYTSSPLASPRDELFLDPVSRFRAYQQQHQHSQPQQPLQDHYQLQPEYNNLHPRHQLEQPQILLQQLLLRNYVSNKYVIRYNYHRRHYHIH